MGEAELLVGRHVFRVRQFTVEGHDWSERVTLRDQTQFSGRKIVIIAHTVHL